MRRQVGAIILAAGEGARFGQPKALAVQDGKSYLWIAIERLHDAGYDQITVVLGAEAERVRHDATLAPIRSACGSSDARLTFAFNPHWRKGRTSSIICGLHYLWGGVRGALIHQVDFPSVTVTTFRRLAFEFWRTPLAEERIILPVCGGRRGHPVVIGRSLWTAIEAMGPDEPLRTLIHLDATVLTEVLVDDPGILRNVNTAAQAAGWKT